MLSLMKLILSVILNVDLHLQLRAYLELQAGPSFPKPQKTSISELIWYTNVARLSGQFHWFYFLGVRNIYYPGLPEQMNIVVIT